MLQGSCQKVVPYQWTPQNRRFLQLLGAALTALLMLLNASHTMLYAQPPAWLTDETPQPRQKNVEGVAEESILEQEETSTLQFLISLSGTVNKENFTGAKALLTLSIPPDASSNPYLLTVQGYPQRNARNSFYWNSEATVMTAQGGAITSELKPSVGIEAGIHFFFLSPVLLEKRVFMTQLEKKRKAQAEAVALPTKIFAQTGKMTLSLYETTVSGTISMTGYDDIEHAYVTYSATFSGFKTNRLQPKEELKK